MIVYENSGEVSSLEELYQALVDFIIELEQNNEQDLLPNKSKQ